MRNLCLYLSLSAALLTSGQHSALAKSFVVGGASLELQDLTSTVEVYYQAMRFNRASNQWNFDIALRNTALTPLTGPVVVLVDSYQNTAGPLTPDGIDGDGKAYYDLSSLVPPAGLIASHRSATRTLALGVSSGNPQLGLRVYGLVQASGPALALARTLNEFGQPMVLVPVAQSGPAGQATGQSDASGGVVTLGQGSGTNVFSFGGGDFLPVWRTQRLLGGVVSEIPSPRLVKRSAEPFTFSPIETLITRTNGNIQLTIPAGAFPSAGVGTLTVLDGQTLPAMLPLGWSPLRAFCLELSSEPNLALPVKFDLTGPLGTGEPGALVRWNPTTLSWEVVSTTSGLGASVANAELSGAGTWALVVPDNGTQSPPPAVSGQPLGGATPLVVDYSGLDISSAVTPPSSTPSREPALVTAVASLTISNRTGSLVSGSLLRARVSETYRMRDGSVRVTPSYETWFVGYRRPGTAKASLLYASFPLRPLLLFGPDELAVGLIDVEILPPTAFAGAVFGADGGSAASGRVRLTALPGKLTNPQAIRVDTLDLTNFSAFASGLDLVTAFHLSAGELISGGVQLQVSNLTANANFVLARVLSEAGVYALEPVQRLAADQAGALTSLEPNNEPRLSGITRSGDYVLAKVTSPQTLVVGIARNSQSNAVPGMLVRLAPWATLSGPGGAYKLLAGAGNSTLGVTDTTSGDTALSTITIASGQDVFTVEDQATASSGPVVVSVTPADGSTNVPLVSSIVVNFSKPVNPSTVVGNGAQLFTPSNTVVNASVALNLRGDQLTLLANDPLQPQSAYRLELSPLISDIGGRPLEGPRSFSFSTAGQVINRDPSAQLITYEPTNGVMQVRGTAGFAQPSMPVVLVNEGSGRTTTVLASPDGSFAGQIEAAVDDEISVSVVNANGSRDRVSPNRQIFSDGSVGLFASGGTITVQGENGPMDFIIEPGAIASKTKLKFEAVPLTNVLTLVSNVQPGVAGRILGGVQFSAIQGSPLSQRIEVSFPVKLSDMQLPAGVEPTNCAYGLAIARVIEGAQVFELIDRMHYEDGKLVTHSPPFFGLLGPFEDILLMPLLLFTGSTGLTVNGKVYAVEVDTGTGRPAPSAPKEYLENALVSGRIAGSQGWAQGRLRPGTVYTTSGPEGRYTLLVSVNPSDPSRTTSVTASHPRFPGVRPETGVPDLDPAMRLAIGNVLLGTDVYFPLRAFAQRAPPALAISQVPDIPAVGSNVTLTVLSTDNDSVPTISVELSFVDSLVPGVTAFPADVTIESTGAESPAAQAKRETYSVTCTKAAQVLLRVRALDDDGNKTEQLYPLLFGAPEPAVTNDIPVADPNDKSGPYVVLSQPSNGSSGLAPGDPIVLQFDKPISRQVIEQPALLTITPQAGAPQLSLSRDQTLLTVSYPLLLPGNEYTFGLSNIKDLSGNLLDQDPTLPGAQGFTLRFRMAPGVVTNLVDTGVANVNQIESAGALIRGNYAYVLERRGTQNGRLAVFDLSNPAAPALAGSYPCPAYPRDFLLIPQYSFAWTNPAVGDVLPSLDLFTNIVTRDLIAIVGGLAGKGQYQWLRILDVTEPAKPQFLSGVLIGANDGLTLPTRLRWSPPTLAYLESGQPSAINMLSLQELLIGELLVMNQKEYMKLPEDGLPGLDLNGDGDFVDPGESLPLPARYPLDFAGKIAVHGVFDSDQWVNDFAIDNGGLYVGVVLDEGYLRGTNGEPIKDDDHHVLPCFRSVYSSGLQLDREHASFSFTNGVPRRATTLFQQPLLISNQVVRLDLALVGVRGGVSNSVAVIDLTDRLDMKLLTEVPLPALAGSSNIFSLIKRDDGLVAVASDAHTYLLDPSRFVASATNGWHPALIGVISGLGGSAKTFASTELGLHVSAGSDGDAVVVETAPKLRFVGFPAVAPFSPASLVGKSDAELADRLSKALPQDFLLPSRYRGLNGCAGSTITNLDPVTHYYVLVQAPGGSGPTIDLALESLDRSGTALRKRGLLFPPVHAFTVSTLQSLLQTPDADDASVRSSRAWRLSANPNSKFYNFYLSRPIVLVAEEMSKSDLSNIDSQLERDVLWSGYSLRASFDPGGGTNTAVGRFAGRVDGADRQYKPGVEGIAAAFPADYIQSPNPGPVAGAMNLPLAFNTVAPHSGEITHEATDLELPGRRMGIHFKRTYCGQGLFEGPFGRGWDFNYNQRLTELNKAVPPGSCFPQVLRTEPQDSEVATNRDLLFYTGAGRVVIFKYAGDAAPPEIASDPLVQELGWLGKAAAFYLPPPGLFVSFFKFKDGTYARLEPDGTQYRYNALGRLTRIYDRFDKNFLEMSYNSRGELVRIYDELHRPLDIGYFRVASDPTFRGDVDVATTNPGELGKIARLKDYSKRDVLFHYTEDGLLERRLGPQVDTVALPESFTGRQVTRYLYSTSEDPSKTAKSLIGVTGDDSSGAPFMAATDLGAKGRDTVNRLLIGGKPLTIEQQHDNTALALSQHGGKTIVTQPDESKTAFLLDSFGRVTNSVYSGANAPAVTNASEYYTNGLLKAVTYPEGNRIEYYYDDANPSLRSRGNLLKVRRTPGPRGGPELEATSHFDPWYNLAEGPKTDFNGNTALITLRTDHKDTEFIDSGGVREEFGDNDYGQLVYFKSIDGVVKKWEYSEFTGFLNWSSVGDDRVTYSYTPNTTGSSEPEQRGYPTQLTTPNEAHKNNQYDERGQLIREERGGLLIQRAFDASGRCIKTVSTVEAGRQIVQERAYNQLGFMVTNRLRDIEVDTGSGGGVPTDLVTTYVPDDANRLKEAWFPGGDHHVLEYDHLGRLISYSVDGGYTETQRYDGNGNLTNRFNGVGNQSFVYDGHDRLKSTELANGTVIRQELDGNGNVLSRSATDLQGRLLYLSTNSYDVLNRPVENALLRDDGISVSANTYDPANRRLFVRDAMGAVLTNWFDASGRLICSAGPTVTVTNAYDGDGNLRFRTTYQEGGTYQEQFQYDALAYATNHIDALGNSSTTVVGLDGRVLRLSDKEGHVITNAYSVLGEKTAESDPNAVEVQFGYDLNRKLTRVSDARHNATVNTYDDLGRLTGEKLPNSAASAYTSFTPLAAPTAASLPRDIDVLMQYDVMGKVTNRVVTSGSFVRRETYRYDGLQRPSRLEDPNGFIEYDYDLLGHAKATRHGYTFRTNPPSPATLEFSLANRVNEGGFRTSLILPGGDTNFYARDLSGRLLALTNNSTEAIVQSTVYAGPDVVQSRVLGNHQIQLSVKYDGNQRVTTRQYRRLDDGQLLADFRYAYDKNAVILGRQDVHRGGRTDVFTYDAGYRLLRTDVDAHPSLGAAQGARDLSGFSVPAEVPGQWSAGAYARRLDFNNLDLITGVVTVNPDSVSVSPFAATYSDGDSLLFQTEIDGFTRSRDEIGNVTRTRLLVRIPGQSEPQLVAATLDYDELGRLVRVRRDDGVTVVNEYDLQGNRIRRQVTGDVAKCVPSDRAFIYDGRALLEERDLSRNAALIARYYYLDHAPVAADADFEGTGTLTRFYFLTDQLGSVRGIADHTGTALERVNYDTWGQPQIQLADHRAPRVARIIRDNGDLVVAFTEPVLPPIATNEDGLCLGYSAITNLILVEQGGTPVEGTVTFEERVAGMPFGTCFRFHSDVALTGAGNVRVVEAGVQDEWGNANAAEAISVNLSQSGVLFSGPALGSTQPEIASRCSTGFAVLLHGQMYDYDAGLLHCGARYYDPYTGSFLQRDPAAYSDSVNQYAAFDNNPVNMTDRSGTAAADYADSVRNFGQGAADRFGFPGEIVNTVCKGIGWFMELGTEAAQGWDLLNSDRQGSFGLIDRLRGAQVLIDEGNKVLVAGMVLHAAGSMMAAKVEGYMVAAAHREIDVARKSSREFFAYHQESRSYSQAVQDLKKMGGWHEIESEAALYASDTTGVAAHVRYNEKKAQARYARVSEGYEAKPGWLGTKSDEATGLSEHTVTGGPVRYGIDNETGKIVEVPKFTKVRKYATDVDFYGFTKGSRLAEPAEIAEWENAFRTKFEQLKLERGMPHIQYPKRHPSQLELAQSFGRMSGGKKVTNKLIKKVGEVTANSTVLTIAPGGGINKATDSYMNSLIDLAEPGLKRLQQMHGEEPVGFIGPWRFGANAQK